MVVEGEHPQADGNASFLRAARSGNLEKVIEFLKGTIDINTSNANGLNALHLAAKEGHVNVVTELIKRGANVNAATKKGNTALHIASLAGQEEVVKVLVKLGANVNVQSQNGFTPLYMAAQENHDAVVSFLLANGANQSLATEDGFTPLAVALQQGHDKVVAVLLENDTKGKVRLPALHIAAKKDDCKAATLLLQSDHNPDVTSKSGFTPLHIAAHYGNENIAKILLTKGADVNYAAKHQITPLHVASKWGKINMVTLLLEKGANIDASTRDGLTPLHCAARSGHDQVVDLLLEKGAPFLAKTKNGLAPLHMASQGDHVDSARILLYHKAPVDDVTVDYLTALHVAAHCGHVKVAKLLLDRKADPNARALNGFTPLHIACKKNRIKVVELLLKHGASIEATTESGLTPLHVASFMGCMNIVIYLIQNGSNPDVPTVRGETPLHLAARANQTDIIRILLRNGASVDARAREEQTPLHIAARLGNVDIVSLLLQHGAAVDAVTKDMYTPLHITAKEDQEEVAAALLDHGASLTATTKKGFTPLHLAAKYGNIKVARLLLQKGAPVDAQGKNGVTPLHVAAHYDHVNVALLLLDKGASPHAMAKNGYTPLHIAAKKNQMDIASTLLEYGANTNSESKAGFTPLHLSAQEGHADMSSLLIENKADVNHKANNGLTPLHLCAQDDRVNVAQVLVKNGAEICPQTKAGYTPLHVASHFGQINMVRFLLQNDANVHTVTSHGYTPLHQAAQQGHTLVVNLLLENQASPNVTTVQGQTPLSIAQRLGYISVVETLKVVTETTVTTTTTTVTEEKYKVVAPETMQETFMTDSEDEGGADFDEAAIFGKPTHATHIYLPYVEGQNFYMSEEAMLGDQSYRYLTADEMKSLGDDSLPIDVTKDEKQQDAVQAVKQFVAPMVEEDNISPQHGTPVESGFSEKFSPDNIDLVKAPVHAGMDDAYYYLPPKGMLRSSFLVSFMVDARGGAMRGCRHSGVRVIIPPRKASMPMRITCRYLRKEKLIHPPPLMEGEACASRILEMGPVGARFLGPVIIEVPHFASTRGKEREITILRSDTGESWREHTLEASEEAVQEVLNESFEGEELSALEDLNTNRITRILTTDFPQYFAIVTRIRQEVHGVGPEGGMVSSTVVPQVQAIFPEGALTKKIRVGLQAQPIAPELVTKLLGNRVAVSPIVTVEPRRRKFHKPITLTIPVPQAATKGMINQYSGDAPTLRLLCSITGSTKSGGSSKAQWEDVTGSTPLTFVNDCVSFTTTVSARFWLMDCRQVNEVTRFATELYQEAVYVPFMSKFVIFAKRHDPFEAQLRVFCMTDDKEDKTLESQEHFTEVAKSRDVEVLEGKLQYLEFAGNLVPVTKSGEQLKLTFQAFHENRLPFIIRVKDPHAEPMGRIAFMKEPKAGRGEPPQTPICNLNVALPDITLLDSADVLELVTLEKRYDFIQEAGLSKPELIHRADLRLSDIARELDKDWILLAQQLDVQEQDVEQIKAQTICDQSEQARMMLRLWLHKSGPKATGNELEKGLRKINREDIIKNCMFNVELVTDDVEKAVAKVHLDQSGFDVFKEELGSSREASMRRGTSLDDEQDIMKEAESAAETSSETGSLFERDHLSQAFSDERDEFAMLSVHETALSDTDAPFNSNKPAFDDSNNILKSLNNCNFDEDISKSNYDSYSSEGNTLLFSQTSGKMHDFWPPGMIIQTPLAVSEISDISSPDKFEDTVEKESALNDSFQSNIAFESDMPSELKASLTDNESFVDTKEILNNESVEYNNIINTCIDVSIDNPYESSDFSFPIKTDDPNSNSYENKYDEEVEYVASLEPDVEIADESIDNFLPSDINYKSGSKGVIIEEVPSSNGSEPGEPRFPFQSPGISCPMSGNNNKFPSLDAEQNLYPIEENEKDECDAVTEPGTTYETSLNESLNSYNIMQNELNNISSVSIEPHDKIYNGFKHETSTEASDLGYFSLDKDSSLSSTSAISEEKIKQLESELFSSIFEDKNRLNEKISVSILPEISGDIQSTMKVFVDKEEGKLKYGELDEYNTQIGIDKDKLQDISFKSSDACIKEENKIVKNEEYSYPKDAKIRRASKTPPPSPIDETVDKGGIELEKLQEISNLLPEVIESEVQKPEESDFRKVEVIVKEHVVIQEIPSKLTESETWQSGDLDTSQVSVSSLPEDDKSEPTTTTVSSTAVQEITKSIVPDTEPDEDLEDETLSPIKFKEDLCSKKVSPTKSIFGSNIFMSPKMPSSVQLTPEKILCLQELSLSPVKEDAEIETKETCTSPCSDKLETVKPNQLISTRKGFRTRKRLSPIHDGNKIEQKLPCRVDKGLSPIAVLTAGPSGVEEEGSEYFVQTYDAPAMQEPIPSSSMFCSKSTEMSPKSIFEKDASKSSISKILLEKDEISSKSVDGQKAAFSIELTQISKSVISDIDNEKQIITDVKSSIKAETTPVKVEKSTSPLSDIMLDTGIGTDSPLTADTASSPFFPETLSPSSLSMHSAAQLMKENSSTQTIQVEMLSAHTSPIDGPFSLQESNISCCGTESSLKSDSLDDISRTLGTPSSDIGLDLHYSPQNQSKDPSKPSVKEFLEEHTASDTASDVMEAEDVSSCSSHEIVLKTDLPSYITDRETVDKMLVIESFRNVFATEPPFSVVVPQHKGSPKRHSDYGKKRRSLVSSEASSDDRIFSLHDQLLSEESALESSTDSGVDLKESSQGFVTYTTTVHSSMSIDKQETKIFADESISNLKMTEKTTYETPVTEHELKSEYYEKKDLLFKSSDGIRDDYVEEGFKDESSNLLRSENISTSVSEIKSKDDQDDIIPDYVKKVEKEISRSSATHITDSPVHEINTFYMQQIFQSSSTEDNVENKVDTLPENEDINSKPIDEKIIVPIKLSLSFDRELKHQSLHKDIKSSDCIERVGKEIHFAPEEFSPTLEVDVVEIQKGFQVVDERSVITASKIKDFVDTKSADGNSYTELQHHSSLEKEIKTSSNNDGFIQKDTSAHAYEHKTVPGFIEKVEEEILRSQSIISSISPIAEMSSVYAQEIFQPSVSEENSSISVKPEAAVASDEFVVEKPVVPVKASLSSDSVDTQSELEKEMKTSSDKEELIQKEGSVHSEEQKTVPGFLEKVEDEVLCSQSFIPCKSPVAEMSSIYAQEIFNAPVSEDKSSISVKPDSAYATSEPVEEKPVIPVKTSLSFDTVDTQNIKEFSSGPDSLLEKEIKTSSNKDTFIQKESSVHADEHKDVSDFIEKVEEEIIHSQSIVSCISPAAEMSSVYAQEIFEPSVSEDKSPISVKPDSVYATSEPVEEKPVIPVKTSLSFDTVDTQNFKEISSGPHSLLEKEIKTSSNKDSFIQKDSSVHDDEHKSVSGFIEKVEEEILHSQTIVSSISPAAEMSSVYAQEIFEPSVSEDKTSISVKPDATYATDESVQETPVIPVKASLSFEDDDTEIVRESSSGPHSLLEKEIKTSSKKDSFIQKDSSVHGDEHKDVSGFIEKVEEELLHSRTIVSCISPAAEMSSVYAQEIFEPSVSEDKTSISVKPDATYAADESIQETPVIPVKASLSFEDVDTEIVKESSPGPHSLLEKEIKTSSKKDSFIQKDSSVHGDEHKAVSGFIEKVEEEILHSRTIVSCISPAAEMSSGYAQEIFEPSVSEDKTSISVKPDATYAADESIQETPVIPVKASLSFDAVDNIREFSSRQSSTLKYGGSMILECAADYVSEKETFSNVVDRIFSSAEIDSYVSKPRTVDDIFVAEATVIKDKRNSLCLSDSQKISPKLEQSTSTDTTVEEIMDVDKSGTTTHIIQKTTHMTLVSHATSDNLAAEGELQGDIPVESVMDEETSPHSPDLSFAEKRDFFQKLSLSSSSPSVTPTHTSKTNIETEIKLLPVTDNIANLEISPEEQLSFVERVKFFENAAEKHTVQTVQTIMPEVKEIKKEVWTVSENELSEPKSSVYSDETYEKEREIETIEVLEETSCISAADKGEVSSPLYANKEVLETTFDTNKDAKVEVMVKKFSPGSEMFEICSVENISKPQEERLAEVTDAISKVINIHPEGTLADKKEAGETTTEEKVLKHEILEKISTEVKQEIDLPKSEDTDQPETDEEYISKTFKAVTESSYEASRSTVGAFKKGINEKLENKWQRESPDNISIVKETMEPSLGKSEIFICTEETLDNVKKILSVADAESNIVVPENETTSVETQHEGTDNDTLDDSKPGIFICTEETLDNVKKILSVADAESNIVIPESGTTPVGKLQKGIDNETIEDSKPGIVIEEAFEKSDASKIEVTQEYKGKIKSKEDHSKVSKIIDESSTKIEQNIGVSYEISISKELIKDSEIKDVSTETELKVEPKMQDVTNKKFSDEIEISKELAKDTKIKELSKETEVKVKPKNGDEIIKKTKDEIEINKELIKDTEIKEFVKETEVKIESKKDDKTSKTVIDKMEITKELIIDTEIKIEPMKDEISKTISDGISTEMIKGIEIKETGVKELKKDDEISKKICEEIEINKELIKDTGIKEFVKETEVRIESEKDDKISKTVIDKIEITKELIKDTEIKIEPKKDDKKMIEISEIKELVKETEVKLESKKDDEISKKICDEIEISKGLIKDTEIKEIFKETEVRIESEKDDKISKKISDEIEISKELVKEAEIKGFHAETGVKKESKKDEEISKNISDEVQISKELIKDTEIKKEVVTEIKMEPVKDDEISKKISDETEATNKLIKDIETKELVKQTEVKIKPKKDGEISKNISDEIEISKEICTQAEKDSKTIQPVGITQSVTIGEQNNARPDSIIMKSSVTHTSDQEIDVTSKDKSLEADIKDMEKEISSDKIETVDSKYEVQQGKISPISIGDKSDTSSAKSIEIEFVPVLEVSNDVKVSVEKTGHEALGTPCSFHKEMSIESQHSELEQSFEKRISDTEKKIPLTTFAAVEKAEYEEVEKSKKENIENIIFRESVSQKTTGKETVQSVEVTQFKKHSTEVYNVPSEKLKGKFSSKKIHIETSAEEKDSKSLVPQKLNQFLDSVTQSHDVALPSDVTPVHKRTVEWLDQTGDMMLKEGAIIDNVDNGLFEDRHPTLDDENQRRSSPTAESFDDKARVEQCDTDVMMQLLDFVSRNDIELAEVRTEDEAPDIEEDVSPSGEEEISSRITYEEGKVDDKILIPENFDEKSDDYLRVSKSDNLQLSPLRSSFDSVTSPSKRDFSSDNIETVLETKHFIEEVKHEQIHPQSSLEVEVGSHDSDEYCHLEIEREIVPLSFVEEEESAKIESKHSSREEKFSKLEDIKQYAKETATASIVIDSAGKSSTDLNENEDKSKHPEEIKVVSGELEMTTKSSELPKTELDAAVDSTQAISETGEKHSGAHVEALQPETDTVDSEELCKITKDVYISEKDSDLMAETQHSEKSVSSFTSCAFINTAFAGADAIDEVEQVSPVRARSPYEVIRGKDDHVSDGSPDDKTSLSTSDRVTYVTKHVEIRRRPLLQHIPSEISEEDLVEREIISPIHELELSDQAAETESGILRFDTSDVSGIKAIPLETKVSEVSTYTVVKNVSMPVEAEDKIVKTESSDATVVKTVTVTKVEHSDQSSDYQYITSIKDRPSDIQIKSDISEILAKAKDITTPESDTGIPTSPFELVSESEMSDIEHKFSTSAVSHSSAKSEKGDKSKDSVITTTHSQSITDKTVSVSIPSSEEHKDSLTLNGKSESSKTEDVSHAAEHSTVNITSDDKPLTNGPGEVEYHPEYDYDGESISKKFEHVYAERSVYETPETDEEPKCHYSSVSDDVIDSEIREILSSDQQLEDIIERPVTPEPPRDDITDLGFVSRLKRPSDGEIEGLMREEGFAYSDDAPLSSPTSPDSKSGFAYGMHFEKYVIDEGEEAMDIDSDQFSEEKEPPYSYDMTFEHEPELEEDVPCYGDLYTHEEEDEDVLENGEKSKVLQKLNSKDSEFDILAGRKYFSKNVEIDELSMSSLQEFERLEAEIVSGRKSSVGSLDSLNGKQLNSKSGDHDDVSMSSLTEFERIEKECTEGDKIDPSMQESITQLSEIEEGHESQASEASQENKSDVGRMEDISLADDYSNQLENIEELILEVEGKKTDELPFQIMMKQTQKTEQTGHSIEITSKEKQIDNKISDISKETVTKTSTVTQVSKIPCWTTSKSLESSSLGDARDDLDQDSLRDELSLKPDSLIDDTKLDFQDSLHEERFDDADSLQENIDEMRDSLFEERHIEDDSLHEMDIMPDESSLSLEGSLPAIASLDSSKADEPIKLTITNLTDSKGIQPEIILGSETENFQIRQTQINISDFPRGADIMQSSTDSLEQSSSALAAFQIESESLMSSSLNSAITSGEDYTMVSSSDTIEPEGRITYRYEDIPVDDIEMLVRSGHRVIVDSEGNIQTHYEGKPCIETEEIRNTALGFHKDTTEIKLPPTTTVQVHSALTTVGYVNGRKDQEKHFHHTSGEEDYESFESSHFDPDVEVEEIQTTDEFGNTKIIRKIKKVSHTKTQFSSSSSPKNVEEQLKEFLREHTAGDKASSAEEEIEEQKTTDEKGNVVVIRTVKRHIHTEPEVHSKTFTGPTADQQSKKFVETFQTLDPTEDVSEYEKVDEQGNVVRVTEKFVVTPKVHTVSFSGPDAHKQMEDYMKQWTLQSQNLGEFEGDQQRAMLPSLQTGRTFEQSETSAPSDSSEHLVQNVIGDTIVTKTLSSTFSADSSEKIEIPESSTSTTTISIETVRSKSDSSEDTKSMPK